MLPPKPPAAVLFDFDGTLADTAPDMTTALNDWLAARTRPSIDAATARAHCSGGARALLALCGIGAEPESAAIADYLTRYEHTGYKRTILFDGIVPLLAALNAAGIPWGVATNKPSRYFAPIAATLLTPHHPTTLIARDDDRLPAKPHPATLLAAATQCGAPPSDCVYIGDDIRDAQAAQNADIPFIAATWGYWRPDQWQNAPPPIAALTATSCTLLPLLTAAARQK